MEIFETNRLKLRELAVGRDEDFILDLLNTEGFVKFIGDRGVRDLEGARNYILNGPAKSYDDNGFGLWVVELGSSGERIGLCGMVRREGLDHPDIGYAFLPDHGGRGYAVEAAGGTLAHARSQLDLKTLCAVTTPDNAASRRVLEKIGLVYQGLIVLPGRDDESTYYLTAD
jgi:RimJ/RimL family protein N-acetyltransferase